MSVNTVAEVKRVSILIACSSDNIFKYLEIKNELLGDEKFKKSIRFWRCFNF